MSNKDEQHEEILAQPDRKTMDTEEWAETVRLHEAQSQQRYHEVKTERAKASVAKARATLQRLKDAEPHMPADIAARRQHREMYGEIETLSHREPES
jgi:hypothetical protein